MQFAALFMQSYSPALAVPRDGTAPVADESKPWSTGERSVYRNGAVLWMLNYFAPKTN